MEAESEFRTLLEIQQRVLGPDDISTIDSTYDLATMLHSQEKYQEAREQIAAAYAGRLKLLGEEHPDTVMAKEYLERIAADQTAADH